MNITEDGITTITAYTVDKAGNVSLPATREVKKDSVKPTGSLEVNSVGPWSIKVTANGQDALSGIYSYSFQYKKKTETNWSTIDQKVTRDQTLEYTYKNLEGLTEYEVKLIITDKAGNEEVYTNTAMTKKEPQIGDYVDYTPDNGSYIVEAKYSGHTEDQTFTTENFGWRIWNIDKENDELVLISDNMTTQAITLKGYQGYNNVVPILHNICENCYSNTKLHGISRSINYENTLYYLNTENKPYYSPTGLYTNGHIRLSANTDWIHGSVYKGGNMPYVYYLERYSCFYGAQGTTSPGLLPGDHFRDETGKFKLLAVEEDIPSSYVNLFSTPNTNTYYPTAIWAQIESGYTHGYNYQWLGNIWGIC